MSAKKGLVIAGVVVVALVLCAGAIAVPIVWLVSATGEVAQAADRFLELLGQQKFDAAYESAATALRSRQSLDEFTAEVRRIGLDNYASSAWPSRNFKNDEGTLEGSITLKNGNTLPMKITLQKEEGTWRVLSVADPNPGVGTAPASAAKTIPPDDDLRALVTESLLKFDEAVKAEDFTAFHAHTSSLLQSQKTPDELKQAFQGFIDNQIDLAGIKDVRPEFDAPPSFNEEGSLVVSGYYPTNPLRVKFQLTWVYEHPRWKLLGISVNATSN